MNGAISGELAATTSRLPIESSTTTSGMGYQWPRRVNDVKSSPIVVSLRPSLITMNESSAVSTSTKIKVDHSRGSMWSSAPPPIAIVNTSPSITATPSAAFHHGSPR